MDWDPDREEAEERQTYRRLALAVAGYVLLIMLGLLASPLVRSVVMPAAQRMPAIPTCPAN